MISFIANSNLVPPAWLNCPVNVILPADHRRSTTMVTWPIPRAVDQSGSRLITTSTIKPPVLLGVGVTKIKYNAVSGNGMLAECSFNVEIIGKKISPDYLYFFFKEMVPIMFCLHVSSPPNMAKSHSW